MTAATGGAERGWAGAAALGNGVTAVAFPTDFGDVCATTQEAATRTRIQVEDKIRIAKFISIGWFSVDKCSDTITGYRPFDDAQKGF